MNNLAVQIRLDDLHEKKERFTNCLYWTAKSNHSGLSTALMCMECRCLKVKQHLPYSIKHGRVHSTPAGRPVVPQAAAWGDPSHKVNPIWLVCGVVTEREILAWTKSVIQVLNPDSPLRCKLIQLADTQTHTHTQAHTHAFFALYGPVVIFYHCFSKISISVQLYCIRLEVHIKAELLDVVVYYHHLHQINQSHRFLKVHKVSTHS